MQRIRTTIAKPFEGLAKVAILGAAIGLSACGPSGGVSTGSPLATLQGNNNIGGISATGAPMANVPVAVKTLVGVAVSNGRTDNNAFYQFALTANSAPYVVEVLDTGVNPNRTYRAVILKSDLSSGGQNINVTPLSDMVYQVMMSSGRNLSSLSDGELQALRSASVVALETALKPIFKMAGVSESGLNLLTHKFIPTLDAFDKALDAFTSTCSGSSCVITLTSAKAQSLLGGTLNLSFSSTSALDASAKAIAAKLSDPKVQEAMSKAAPVVVVMSAEGGWGTATDSWAGYTGKLGIYNFTDQSLSGEIKLYFESSKLRGNGFWNTSSSVIKDGKFSLTLPTWATLAPMTSGVEKPFVIGFNGSGFAGGVDDLSNCNINGQKCIILRDDGKLNLDQYKAGASIRSWSQFLVALPASIPTPPAVVPPASTNPPVSTTNPTTTPSATPAELVVSSASAWVGGFNGNLSVSNTSGTPWSSWSFKLTLPSELTAIGGWGSYKLTTEGRVATFSNESWNGALGVGKSLNFGFGGSGSLNTAPTNCQISYNGGAYTACTVTLGTPTPVAAPTPPPVVTPTPPTPTPPAVATPPVTTPVAPVAPVAGAEPTTIASSVKADQTKRVFVGYYPSWSDNWFSSNSWDGTALSDDKILATSKFARIPATYTHIVAAFAKPDFSYSKGQTTWDGTGLNFNSSPQDIKRAVDVLHKRGLKVLLAVGGATYNDWGALAAENGSTSGAITNALKNLMLDVGFDGLDVDYEVEGTSNERISEYAGAIRAMRKAVDLAGGGRQLALAGWSTGADCTVASGISGAPACAGKTSYWGGSAGRERLVLARNSDIAAKLDMVNIMSYDARYENYDGVKAWELYRDLFPSTTIVSIGLETAPEGWAGGMLVVNDADAQCAGSTILKDQFSNAVNKPYSVNRYAGAVSSSRANSHPRDGVMLWEILKKATAACGSAVVASPGPLADKVSELYRLPKDSRSAWQ